MTIITATELKNNLGSYIEQSSKEDIYVTKNGKIVTMLSRPNNRMNALNDIVGKLKSVNVNSEYDDLKYAYLKEKYNL